VTFRETVGRRLLLLVACLATVVVLGSWDNQREIERVLEHGYATTAQITGAQFQRSMPFALDGWWPRLVEQGLSIDLSWQGKDGRPRAHKKVPVTEGFARTIISSDQVKLITLPVRVQDDDRAVPVVIADSAPRLASLQSWLKISGYIATFAWATIAAMGIWRWRRGVSPTIASPPATVDMPRRLLFGLLAVVVGVIVAFYGWSAGEQSEEAAAGVVDTTAEIIGINETPSKAGTSATYSVQLAWKDDQGAVHHYGPLSISEAFWKTITDNGRLAVRQTRVRIPADSQARPSIPADRPDPGWQARLGLISGLVLAVAGLGLLVSALWRMRRLKL